MRPEYDGIKFYSASDLSAGYYIKLAVPILEAFTPEKQYTDINEILELYNIRQLIDVGYLPEWDNAKIQQYKSTCQQYQMIIRDFFGGIDDSNFIHHCDSVCISYWDDYWDVFVNQKVYKRISKEIFSKFLSRPDTDLTHLLHREELVKHFDHEFAEIMRTSCQTASIIVDKFLKSHDTSASYCIPKELNPDEFNGILQQSIDSGNAGWHTLQLLITAPNNKCCPINDKVRLSAKHAAETFWEKRSAYSAKQEYGINLTICNQAEWKKAEHEGSIWNVSYDIKWLVDNLDYPTILNNFAYTFEQFDLYGRSTLVSKASHESMLERIFQTRGVKDYPIRASFNFQEALTTMQTGAYYNLLSANDIRLEDIFHWFFSTYLPHEFQVYGFRFNPPTEESTLVEKCRSLASEMDGVLKQFKMYVEDGTIDWELFAMSSKPVSFIQIPSFHKHKYAYIRNKAYQSAQQNLFSEQSILAHMGDTPDQYHSFYDLLLHKKMHRNDFDRYHEPLLHSLVNCGFVSFLDSGELTLNDVRCSIMKDAFENEVLCPLWAPSWQSEIEALHVENVLSFGCTLFSIPEAKYMNYMLNKAEFSNGLDLRNKYIHSSYSSDEKTTMTDYVRLLKIMVLVIWKINEEFCFRDKLQISKT